MPRIVKILALLLVFAAWMFFQPPSPTAALNDPVDSVLRDAYPDAVLLMRHASPAGNFLYYRPVPEDPERILSHLPNSAEVQMVVRGRNWYVSAVVNAEGNRFVVDFYPDYENNRLVVLVR